MLVIETEKAIKPTLPLVIAESAIFGTRSKTDRSNEEHLDKNRVRETIRTVGKFCDD